MTTGLPSAVGRSYRGKFIGQKVARGTIDDADSDELPAFLADDDEAQPEDEEDLEHPIAAE